MSEVQAQAAKPNGTAVVTQDDVGAAMERVMVSGDLSGLTPSQRSEYYMRVCQSVGLNPYTKPFAYIKLNGKLTLYALKDCTDQLRQIHKISIELVDRKLTDGFLSVHARATDKDGRKDEDYGVIPVSGTLSGEAGANLIMKCVTKAKRRVTLSICGLAILDETEVSSIAGAEIVDIEGRHVATVEAPPPPPKRKSSAEGKRDGSVKEFNALLAQLEKADGAISCQETWNKNAKWLSTCPRGWYETLLEAYVATMKGFEVEIDDLPEQSELMPQAAE
jgi:hypothetical protein